MHQRPILPSPILASIHISTKTKKKQTPEIYYNNILENPKPNLTDKNKTEAIAVMH